MSLYALNRRSGDFEEIEFHLPRRHEVFHVSVTRLRGMHSLAYVAKATADDGFAGAFDMQKNAPVPISTG